MNGKAGFKLPRWLIPAIVLLHLFRFGPGSEVYADNSVSQLADRLKTEIENLESRIKEGEAGRRSAVEQLQDIDRKIELRRRLILELERSAESSNRKVTHIGGQIESIGTDLQSLTKALSEAESDLMKLRAEASKRMVYFYKRITGVRLALLSGVDDLNDMARRRKYFASIEGFDRRSLERIAAQAAVIESNRKQRENLRQKLSDDQQYRLKELDRYRYLLQEKRQEEAVQLTERASKTTLLQKIENDNTLLKSLLEERRQALEEIEREISRQEQAIIKKGLPEFKPDVPFAELAGRLLPPIPKLIISQPFGPSRHPKLGTTTINPGVDFKAQHGEKVQAVANGQVTRVAWLRGFGNTIIIAHGQGYYTVYSKLAQVYPGEGQVVKAGQILGQVADGGASSEFHFEVWSKREKQDPMKWLKR